MFVILHLVSNNQSEWSNGALKPWVKISDTVDHLVISMGFYEWPKGRLLLLKMTLGLNLRDVSRFFIKVSSISW